MDKAAQDAMAEALGHTEKPEVVPEAAPTPVEKPAVEEKPADVTPKPEETKEPEQTIAEILKAEPAPAPKLVPEAALISEKKGRKDAERALKALQDQVAAGATREDVSDDIDALLEEFGLDDTNKQFFNKMMKVADARADARAKATIAAQMAPLEADKRDKAIETAFQGAFKDALERNPEYDGIAKANVIKALSLLPENANKTFSQILEDTYGDSIQGKRTIETTSPGGTKEPTGVDFDKAKTDTAYFETIMANPALKKEYNDGLAKRLRL